MKERIYRLLIGRVPGIRDRFWKKRQRGGGRAAALLYAIWLNVQYYLLFRRSLGEPARTLYEDRRLYSGGSESSLSVRQPPQMLADALAAYDVISFDVFDTLLFRPLAAPADLFDLVGMTLRYPGFRALRIQAEKQARQSRQAHSGYAEVTLEEIWAELSRVSGIPADEGIRAEWTWERRCCTANSYMLAVVRALRAKGKTLCIVSDMYLGRERIRALLDGCGFGPFAAYFVSGDEGVSKSGGGLYARLRSFFGAQHTFAHVGDNPYADQKQAAAQGIAAFGCTNVQHAGGRYRPQDMSPLTGSLYAGLVNAHLHSGLAAYSREYEYGFVYGGLFVTGYCRFIHAYAKEHRPGRLLFLSRDGAVLLEAYRLLYPAEAAHTVYAYWSRLAAVKLTADYYKADYFRRFIRHKADQGFSIRQIVEAMELPDMLDGLCRAAGVRPEEELTHKNSAGIEDYFRDGFAQIWEHYRQQREAGGRYYSGLLQGCRSAAAVDIGWAGSGAVMLDYAVNRLWELDCRITGLLAGTNTAAMPDADAAEPQLFGGQLVSYLYSSRENRDLWRFHDPVQGHNLYWELLLGAPEGSLKGFYPAADDGVEIRLKETPAGADRIREIHRGILDFVRLFAETEKRLGLTIPISGRDAYAPMLLAGSRKNRRFMTPLEGLLDDAHIG